MRMSAMRKLHGCVFAQIKSKKQTATPGLCFRVLSETAGLSKAPVAGLADQKIAEGLEFGCVFHFFRIAEIGVEGWNVGGEIELHQRQIAIDHVIGQQRNSGATECGAADCRQIVDLQLRQPRVFRSASGGFEPVYIGEIARSGFAEGDDSMVVEIFDGLGFAVAGQIVRRCVDMHMHGEQPALDQIRLLWLAQANGAIGLPHVHVELFVVEQQLHLDIGIK